MSGLLCLPDVFEEGRVPVLLVKPVVALVSGLGLGFRVWEFGFSSRV